MSARGRGGRGGRGGGVGGLLEVAGGGLQPQPPPGVNSGRNAKANVLLQTLNKLEGESEARAFELINLRTLILRTEHERGEAMDRAAELTLKNAELEQSLAQTLSALDELKKHTDAVIVNDWLESTGQATMGTRSGRHDAAFADAASANGDGTSGPPTPPSDSAVSAAARARTPPDNGGYLAPITEDDGEADEGVVAPALTLRKLTGTGALRPKTPCLSLGVAEEQLIASFAARVQLLEEELSAAGAAAVAAAKGKAELEHTVAELERALFQTNISKATGAAAMGIHGHGAPRPAPVKGSAAKAAASEAAEQLLRMTQLQEQVKELQALLIKAKDDKSHAINIKQVEIDLLRQQAEQLQKDLAQSVRAPEEHLSAALPGSPAAASPHGPSHSNLRGGAGSPKPSALAGAAGVWGARPQSASDVAAAKLAAGLIKAQIQAMQEELQYSGEQHAAEVYALHCQAEALRTELAAAKFELDVERQRAAHAVSPPLMEIQERLTSSQRDTVEALRKIERAEAAAAEAAVAWQQRLVEAEMATAAAMSLVATAQAQATAAVAGAQREVAVARGAAEERGAMRERQLSDQLDRFKEAVHSGSSSRQGSGDHTADLAAHALRQQMNDSTSAPPSPSARVAASDPALARLSALKLELGLARADLTRVAAMEVELALARTELARMPALEFDLGVARGDLASAMRKLERLDAARVSAASPGSLVAEAGALSQAFARKSESGTQRDQLLQTQLDDLRQQLGARAAQLAAAHEQNAKHQATTERLQAEAAAAAALLKAAATPAAGHVKELEGLRERLADAEFLQAGHAKAISDAVAVASQRLGSEADAAKAARGEADSRAATAAASASEAETQLGRMEGQLVSSERMHAEAEKRAAEAEGRLAESERRAAAGGPSAADDAAAAQLAEAGQTLSAATAQLADSERKLAELNRRLAEAEEHAASVEARAAAGAAATQRQVSQLEARLADWEGSGGAAGAAAGRAASAMAAAAEAQQRLEAESATASEMAERIADAEVRAGVACRGAAALEAQLREANAKLAEAEQRAAAAAAAPSVSAEAEEGLAALEAALAVMVGRLTEREGELEALRDLYAAQAGAGPGAGAGEGAAEAEARLATAEAALAVNFALLTEREAELETLRLRVEQAEAVLLPLNADARVSEAEEALAACQALLLEREAELQQRLGEADRAADAEAAKADAEAALAEAEEALGANAMLLAERDAELAATLHLKLTGVEKVSGAEAALAAAEAALVANAALLAEREAQLEALQRKLGGAERAAEVARASADERDAAAEAGAEDQRTDVEDLSARNDKMQVLIQQMAGQMETLQGNLARQTAVVDKLKASMEQHNSVAEAVEAKLTEQGAAMAARLEELLLELDMARRHLAERDRQLSDLSRRGQSEGNSPSRGGTNPNLVSSRSITPASRPGTALLPFISSKSSSISNGDSASFLGMGPDEVQVKLSQGAARFSAIRPSADGTMGRQRRGGSHSGSLQNSIDGLEELTVMHSSANGSANGEAERPGVLSADPAARPYSRVGGSRPVSAAPPHYQGLLPALPTRNVTAA